MKYRVFLLAAAMGLSLGVTSVARAGMVEEENANSAASYAKAVETEKTQLAAAAAQATECKQVTDQLNEALEKRRDTKALKMKKDQVCKQEFKSEYAVKEQLGETRAPTEAEKAAYKEYAEGMQKYGMKNLAGRPGLENIPTNVAPGFAFADDAKKGGFGMSGGGDGDFGERTSPCSGCSSYHKGQDYSLRDIGGALDTNKKIAASAQGKVTYAGWKKGYGKVVEVDHGRYKTLYAHLDSTNVKVGDEIGYGQVVGIGGSTGVGTAAHLHYGVQDETWDKDGGWVNPTKFQVTSIDGNKEIYTVSEGGSNNNPFEIFTSSDGNYGDTSGGTGTGTGTGSIFTGNIGDVTGGLGTTLQNLLGGTGTGDIGGNNNILTQLLSQLFGDESKSGSGEDDEDDYSENDYSNLIVKTVTTVTPNGDTVKTVTYADGHTEVTTVKGTATGLEQLNNLLTILLGKDVTESILGSMNNLCGFNLSSSSDANMLKISQCQKT